MGLQIGKPVTYRLGHAKHGETLVVIRHLPGNQVECATPDKRTVQLSVCDVERCAGVQPPYQRGKLASGSVAPTSARGAAHGD